MRRRLAPRSALRNPIISGRGATQATAGSLQKARSEAWKAWRREISAWSTARRGSKHFPILAVQWLDSLLNNKQKCKMFPNDNHVESSSYPTQTLPKFPDLQQGQRIVPGVGKKAGYLGDPGYGCSTCSTRYTALHPIPTFSQGMICWPSIQRGIDR